MNISGIVVHARPDRADAVRDALICLPGVEVHAVSAEGKLVVTVEEDEKSLGATAMKFNEIEGVLSAAMIYHHSECDS